MVVLVAEVLAADDDLPILNTDRQRDMLPVLLALVFGDAGTDKMVGEAR